MTAKFTPGPWEVGESDTFGTRVQVAQPHRAAIAKLEGRTC